MQYVIGFLYALLYAFCIVIAKGLIAYIIVFIISLFEEFNKYEKNMINIIEKIKKTPNLFKLISDSQQNENGIDLEQVKKIMQNNEIRELISSNTSYESESFFISQINDSLENVLYACWNKSLTGEEMWRRQKIYLSLYHLLSVLILFYDRGKNEKDDLYLMLEFDKLCKHAGISDENIRFFMNAVREKILPEFNDSSNAAWKERLPESYKYLVKKVKIKKELNKSIIYLSSMKTNEDKLDTSVMEILKIK